MNTNAHKITGPTAPASIAHFALILLLFAPVDLPAATITVTNTAFAGPGTLGTAIANAQNGDTITFALEYPATITPNGSFQVNKSLAILGPGPTNLFIKGNGSVQAAGLFNLNGPSNNITIAGLTITNGNTVYGAGIYNDRCNVIVSNVALTGNSAQNGGGAIFSSGGYSPYNATLTVVDAIISGNTTEGEGGGIYNSGADGGSATVVFKNCALSGNSAQIGTGGAILNDQGTLIISNSIIAANLANTSGGGIANSAQIGKSASLLIANSLLSGNVSTNNSSLGGGVYNAGTSVQIIGCTLSGNSAGGGGAGLASQYAGGRTGSVQIVNSTLSGNLALQGNGNGGGIYLSASPGGTATVSVVDTTLSGNQADYSGGSIYMANSSGASLNMDILTCTSSGNSSLAIFSDGGHVNIGNSILNDDASSLGGTGPFTSLGYNLCSDNGGGFLTKATDQINTEPLLGPLQDNGGPTFTHAPLPGSPAIDKGKNLSGSATDQRGLPRTFDKAAIANAAGGDGTDIGAVESQSYTVVNANDSGAGSLRQAIAESNSQPGTNTIDFAPSAYGTILLTSGELLITNNVLIAGPGATNEAVDGNRKDRIFHIGSNAVPIIATVAGLTLTNGSHPGFPPPAYGGAIFSDSANLTVSNCVAVFNSAGGSGGAIANFSPLRTGAVFRVVNSTFISNNAASYGGAVDNAGLTMAEIRNTTFTGNAAEHGGAIGNLGLNNGSSSGLQIVNSTFSRNTPAYDDIFIASGVSVSVLNSTFVETNGSVALQVDSGTNTLQIGSTILVSDQYSPAIVAYLFAGDSVTSAGFNITTGNGNGFLTNVTDQINTDPLLGPLQDNGGPTFTHAPLPGSPAIDKGKNFSGSSTDQRGFARTVNLAGLPNAAGGDGTDIGAVESQDASLRLVNPGVVSNQFGFNLTGPFTNVVVEASTNIGGSNWTALATNTLGDAALRFNDPAAPTLPKRFYRARVQ